MLKFAGDAVDDPVLSEARAGLVELVHADGTSETFDTPYIGNGFENEIAHMCDCVAKGRLQSPTHPWEQTLFILRQMDAIRKRVGVTYPQDTE